MIDCIFDMTQCAECNIYEIRYIVYMYRKIPEGPVVRRQAGLRTLALGAARRAAQASEYLLVRVGLVLLHLLPRS